MPVIFSEEQRGQIKARIKQKALELFKSKSVRKTTVAELAESVGIAKGTFYNFYASKGQLAAEIIEDFNAVSENELRSMLDSKGRIRLDELYEVYKNAFRPEAAFSYHFSPDDVRWLMDTEETKKFFDPEQSKEIARLVLGYVDGIRQDIDYGYIVNFAKMINLSIENRNAFCEDAFEKNLASIFGVMLSYLRGDSDVH